MLENATSCGHLDQVVLGLGRIVLVVGDVEWIFVVALWRGRGALLLDDVDDAGPVCKGLTLTILQGLEGWVCHALHKHNPP